jgi:hypothetical protein
MLQACTVLEHSSSHSHDSEAGTANPSTSTPDCTPTSFMAALTRGSGSMSVTSACRISYPKAAKALLSSS